MSTVISVENVSKAYRLGTIGGGTLRDDLHRWWARARGRPNPLLKIGEKDHGNRDGETIWAPRDVSFEVKQGEVLGIIGRNDAGATFDDTRPPWYDSIVKEYRRRHVLSDR